jgi:transposase
MNYEAITEPLKVGRDRLSRCLRIYTISGRILDLRRTGRPRKLTDEMQDFVEVRTTKTVRLWGLQPEQEITEKFRVPVNPSTISRKRIRFQFKHQPPRHIQHLEEHHKEARRQFCSRYMGFPSEMVARIWRRTWMQFGD